MRYEKYFRTRFMNNIKTFIGCLMFAFGATYTLAGVIDLFFGSLIMLIGVIVTAHSIFMWNKFHFEREEKRQDRSGILLRCRS